MASASSNVEVVNSNNIANQLVSVNMINVTKLSSTNYITWSAQIKSLLRGYDLLKFIDANTTIPPPTITSDSGDTEPNPDFVTWQRQDSLLFSSLMGSVEIAHQPLIATATTSLDAWKILTSTYAKPSRGHIKQLKNQLKQSTKGTTSVDDYMQQIKAKSDALALLGSPVDQEDLTDIVLDGLNDDYKSIIESIHGRDSPITFSELHEKLINRELAISAVSRPQQLPITANHAQSRPTNWRTNQGHNSSNQHRQGGNQQRTSRPYLGRCQACGTQGHSVKRCPLFRLVSQSNNAMPQGQQQHYASQQPRAYNAMMQPYETPSWLLDSGASHHLTSDLANLSFHTPYNGGEEVQIGNGMGLDIANTGSTQLPSETRQGSQLGGTDTKGNN